MGLACMPEENNGIIRPLLPFKKEELSSYAKETEFNGGEDRSNSDKKYRRNLLRNEVLPFVKKTIQHWRRVFSYLLDNFNPNRMN
jgi:tRNA(Ile)-lysidine synthase